MFLPSGPLTFFQPRFLLAREIKIRVLIGSKIGSEPAIRGRQFLHQLTSQIIKFSRKFRKKVLLLIFFWMLVHLNQRYLLSLIINRLAKGIPLSFYFINDLAILIFNEPIGLIIVRTCPPFLLELYLCVVVRV